MLQQRRRRLRRADGVVASADDEHRADDRLKGYSATDDVMPARYQVVALVEVTNPRDVRRRREGDVIRRPAVEPREAVDALGAGLGVRPRHDRASELDSWDCVDELMAEEDYSQEWGEAVAR